MLTISLEEENCEKEREKSNAFDDDDAWVCVSVRIIISNWPITRGESMKR